MTKARAAVLETLDAAAEPLSAAQVYSRSLASCDQATVYRALDYLESAGRAESFVFRCSAHGTERYFVSAAKPHRHWFHCESCHRFIDLGACNLGSLCRTIEREHGVTLIGHTLSFSGLCGACRAGNGASGA